jgi:hypothetical protein
MAPNTIGAYFCNFHPKSAWANLVQIPKTQGMFGKHMHIDVYTQMDCIYFAEQGAIKTQEDGEEQSVQK